MTNPAGSALRARLREWAPARSRSATIVVLALPLLLLSSCGVPSADLGGDPCLLQQYQGHGFAISGRLQSALNTLAGQADALSSRGANINASQDVTATLTAIAAFDAALTTQLNLLRTGAQPSQGRAFSADVDKAVARFRTGARLLAQAYADALAGDTLAASTVAAGARDWMEQGQLLLGQANSALAALPTWSPNC